MLTYDKLLDILEVDFLEIISKKTKEKCNQIIDEIVPISKNDVVSNYKKLRVLITEFHFNSSLSNSLDTSLNFLLKCMNENNNKSDKAAKALAYLISEEDDNKIDIRRTPEIIYGFRNFIGNAVKFSKSKVIIYLKSDKKNISISVNDDGPGFPDDIKNVLGEPYIKSKSKEVSLNSGLGLGTFLGKTLLVKQGAKLFFSRDKKLGGASVVISWDINNLKSYS